MEAIVLESIIRELPIVIGVFDIDMKYINCSDLWLRRINKEIYDIKGESLQNISPEISDEIINNLDYNMLSSLGIWTKIGNYALKEPNKMSSWKINPWYKEDGTMGGVTIIEENITSKTKQEQVIFDAISTSNIGTWEFDLISDSNYFTRTAKEILGVSNDFNFSLDSWINYFKNDESKERIREILNDAMQFGTSWDVELQVVTLNNDEKWIRIQGNAELKNKKCIRIFGTLQDIDEKKCAELDENEAFKRLKLAAKCAKIGTWNYNLATEKLNWDNNMYQLYSQNKNVFSNPTKDWETCIHIDDREKVVNGFYSAMKNGEKYYSQFRIVSPKGKIKHIKAIAKVKKNKKGDAISVIGANWDVTKFKNAQLQYKESEKAFFGSFDNSVVGMALIDLKGNWLKVNKSICKSLGYTKEELTKISFQDITHPDDLMRDLFLLNELLSGARNGYQIEKRYVHKSGEVVYVIASITSVKSIEGELVHFISQIFDITSRKKADKKVKSMLELTSGQNASLTNFAHIVSHNLRSHSSNLSMLTGFLKNEKGEEEKKTLTKLLIDSSKSLSETIFHLNEVVNINSSVEEKMEPVHLIDVIKNVKKTLYYGLNTNDVITEINVPTTLYVNAVPAYMDSIILNLFTNSIKYRSLDRQLLISVTSEIISDKIIIKFCDNGLGIDLEKHGDKLFGMYKTFHNHREAKGIGLFITKNQIEAMNAKIEVESVVDKGTTFTLSFRTN